MFIDFWGIRRASCSSPINSSAHKPAAVMKRGRVAYDSSLLGSMCISLAGRETPFALMIFQSDQQQPLGGDGARPPDETRPTRGARRGGQGRNSEMRRVNALAGNNLVACAQSQFGSGDRCSNKLSWSVLVSRGRGGGGTRQDKSDCCCGWREKKKSRGPRKKRIESFGQQLLACAGRGRKSS